MNLTFSDLGSFGQKGDVGSCHQPHPGAPVNAAWLGYSEQSAPVRSWTNPRRIPRPAVEVEEKLGKKKDAKRCDRSWSLQ